MIGFKKKKKELTLLYNRIMKDMRELDNGTVGGGVRARLSVK
jgi:hypothetical protein